MSYSQKGWLMLVNVKCCIQDQTIGVTGYLRKSIDVTGGRTTITTILNATVYAAGSAVICAFPEPIRFIRKVLLKINTGVFCVSSIIKG